MSSQPVGGVLRRPNFGIFYFQLVNAMAPAGPITMNYAMRNIIPGAIRGTFGIGQLRGHVRIQNAISFTRLYSASENKQKGSGDNSSPTGDSPTPQNTGHFSSFSLARPIENMILRSRLTRDLDLAQFLAKAASLAIYSVAGVTVLGTLGVDTKPIIAGIGITGFTIGFALKEIATNFLSGVLLVFNKPFQKGQYLKIMGAVAGQNMEGTVESIDARYVLLRTKERGLLMVPSVIVYTNSLLVSDPEMTNK